MNWDRIKRVSVPTTNPVTLNEAKARLRIDVDTDDVDLLSMIRGAADFIEGPNGAGIAITSQQYQVFYDSFPSEFTLPIHPVISVDSIKYELSGEQTLSTSVYETDVYRGLIRPKSGQSWPSTDTVYNAVTVTYTAGYLDVPQDLKDAVLLLAGFRYENREELAPIALEHIPMGARYIIEQYRRHRFG